MVVTTSSRVLRSSRSTSKPTYFQPQVVEEFEQTNPRPKFQNLPRGTKPKAVCSAPATCFVSLKVSNRQSLEAFILSASERVFQSIYVSEFNVDGRTYVETMRTRGAWSKNRANLQNNSEIKGAPGAPKRANQSTPPPVDKAPVPESNLTSAPPAGTRPRVSKNVVLNPHPVIQRYYVDHPSSSDEDDDDNTTDTDESTDVESGGINNDNEDMSHAHRPSLKLKLGSISSQIPQIQTPNPQSAVRTPSIKLKFGGAGSPPAATPTSASSKKAKKDKDAKGVSSATKKRKRDKGATQDEDEVAVTASAPPRKLTLKAPGSAKTPITPAPIFKLKTKGKIPKRPSGVGYDSELEDREIDPVILEAFILRMQPGPDCDYLRKAINEGTVGIHRAQGGADVRMRFLDTNGRRGLLIVNGHQYATSVVDLPCIIEGMKSWDRKGWIKSADICQMMLVLGLCVTDDEAKNYPLPPDVDPKTFAYAHGITAPMKWVRRRRFARTRRARVDDIESIERKVNQLLEADAKAVSSSFQILDHDPRIERDEYSPEYDDEQDAEAEDDDYFAPRIGGGGIVETPGGYLETPAEDIDQDEVDEFTRLFEGGDDFDTPAGTTIAAVNGHADNTLHLPNDAGGADSSVAVTSASATPAASAAPTPAANGGQESSDEDEDDDDGSENDEDDDDDKKEGDDNLQQVKDRIADMESKIKEQTDNLKRTSNAILRKKLARKIQELKDDVQMMKKSIGLGSDDEGDGGD